MPALSVEEVQTEVNAWKTQFPTRISVPIRVEPSADNDDPNVLILGQYDYETRTVTLYADAMYSPELVDQTLNHEVLGHYMLDRLPFFVEKAFKAQILLDAKVPGSTLSPELYEVETNYGEEVTSNPDALADEIWAHYTQDASNWQGRPGYFPWVEQALVGNFASGGVLNPYLVSAASSLVGGIATAASAVASTGALASVGGEAWSPLVGLSLPG